jgi:DNA polymerase-3 subunit gamma/tau
VRAPLAKRIAEERNVSVIAAAITSLIGGTWRVEVRPAAAPAEAATPSADPRDEADYEPANASSSAPAVDPEAEAMRLLRDELGARPLEG